MPKQATGKAAINIMIPLELKNRVEEIALARKHEKGERVTVTDLVVEGLRKVVADYENKAGQGAD